MKRLQDFFVWMQEVIDGFAKRTPPARALGIVDGTAVLLKKDGDHYVHDRPAQVGDSAPLLLGDDDALIAPFGVTGEAALHGFGAAKIEAARRCPFPLEDAQWSLTRAPEAWDKGAPWRLAAAPQAKVAAIREALTATGARAGDPFVLMGGDMITLNAKGRVKANPLVAASALIALLVIAASAIAVEVGAERMEAAAEARLNNARNALFAAEAKAVEASEIREAAAAPIRAAIAGDALLRALPPAGLALTKLTDAAPDDAHLRRLTIRSDALEGEFIAPDAAALARVLAEDAAFTAAAVNGAARTDAETGLQRALLRIEIANGREEGKE